MSETRAVQRKADQLPAPLLSVVQGLMPDVYRLLPSDITPDQFRAACWLEITGRRELHDCVLESLRDSIIDAANKGLMPGRDCHFLPFKQKKYGGKKGSQCVPNYVGILRTLDRSGKIRRAFAHPVYEGDEWGFDMFADRPIHKPAVTLGKKQGKELFYYGAVMFHDGTCAFEVLTLEDLEAIRKRAPAHESGPWVTDTVMMKRKSALKRVAKYVQLTPEQRQILEEDDARLREDIPPERHMANVVALFGETHGSPYAPQEPREGSDSSPTLSPGGESIVGQSDANQRVSSPQRETSSWRTLEAHVTDEEVPAALRTAAEMLLEDADATEQQAFAVAGRMLDYLDGKREALDEAQTGIF